MSAPLSPCDESGIAVTFLHNNPRSMIPLAREVYNLAAAKKSAGSKLQQLITPF
jgi:hypothetical protein